ncbi:hypothetical protein M9434_003059 [Picochlorum sp. BPE23]|nr:hypothetical protein M9434_003059 [Picochlorum sp. BPE23]
MLTFIKVPQDKAVKVALELKKWLVDSELFDIQQSDLEHHLFRFLETEGFGSAEIHRFKLVSRFHQSRLPLVIVLCGLQSRTKTAFAQQLSHRLNLPNVLRTDALEDMLRYHPDVAMDPHRSMLDTSLVDKEGIIQAFKEACQIVHCAIQGDIDKAFHDGKSVIIEGFHVDPGYFATYTTPEKSYSNDHMAIIRATKKHACLVLPIILYQDDEQYALDAHAWISSTINIKQQHTHSSSSEERKQQQKIVERLRIHKEYMLSYRDHPHNSHRVPCFGVDMFAMDSALDDVHEYILSAIEGMHEGDD